MKSGLKFILLYTCVCLGLFFSLVHRALAVDTFSFIVAGDPQPWRLDTGDPNSSTNQDPWKITVDRTYLSMKSLGARFMIINGDMTEYGRIATWNDTVSAYQLAELPVLFGLGNHDYRNNVNHLSGGDTCFNVEFTGADACALSSVTRVLKYMHPTKSWGGLRGLDIVASDTTTLTDREYSGSLAYSFEYGGIHFIQLNLCPTYQVALGSGVDFKAYIRQSVDWAIKNASDAAAAGYKVVVNYHEPDFDDSVACPASQAFVDMISKYVDAVFTAHLHEFRYDADYQDTGTPGFVVDAIFHGGYYKVDVDNHGMTVTEMNGLAGFARPGKSYYAPWKNPISPIIPLPWFGSYGAPAATVYNGRIYLAYQDALGSGDLHITSSPDGVNWAWDLKLEGRWIKNSPALAAYDGKLYMVYQGRNTDMYYTYFDGSNWAYDAKIPVFQMVGSPALAAYNNRLYLVYQDGGANEDVYYASFDGHSWSDHGKIPNVKMRDSPALAVFKGKLYMVHQGSSYIDGAMYILSFDGTSWSPGAQVPDNTLWNSPALLASAKDNLLYIAFHGNDPDGTVYLTSFDGTNWGGTNYLSHFSILDSPALVEFNDQKYVLAQGKPSSTGAVYFKPW